MPLAPHCTLFLVGFVVGGSLAAAAEQDRPNTDSRPNFLFCIADDWGWPHASAYGDPVVHTPTFDRLAREGVLFRHAYVSSPSCTPSRGAILTGQSHWRLGGAANLWSIFPDRLTTYPEILAQTGYRVGTTGKNWGPGKTETPGRPLAGRPFKSFEAFLAETPLEAPFCFWLGSADPHRPYDEGSGQRSGIDLDAINLPACLPDNAVVRGDVADYYFEVQRFDRLVGQAVAVLEEAGELENTIIVMTGDHGMPFPRGKSNLYDTGTRVPLAIRWGKRLPPGRTLDNFVSLTDLAPTWLEAAGIQTSEKVKNDPLNEPARQAVQSMTGRSLMPLLLSEESGRIDPQRDHVIFGKERHVPAQERPDMGGYPSRGIRTDNFLYIRNFAPDRWPNGTPHYEQAARPGTWYGDTDNGPTKTNMIANRKEDEESRRLYKLAFAKRPAEELYDLRSDPEQLRNVADQPEYAETREALAAQLVDELKATNDPRIVDGAEVFEDHPYLGSGPKHPDWKADEN